MYINIERLGNTLIATDPQITPYYELRSGAIAMVVRLGTQISVSQG
jgi:hypothetical protein